MTFLPSTTADGAKTAHPKPFVYEEASSKSLHFTIDQLQSRMRISHPTALDLAYTRTMMGFLVLNSQPRNIAMIGLGGGSLAKFCRQYVPLANFIAIEINPQIIALRDEFHIPKNGDLFHVVEADGAEYVHRFRGSLDVLLVDGYDHQGQPAQLCSEEFYESCQQALTAEGVLGLW
jgi:spermidine synthase